MVGVIVDFVIGGAAGGMIGWAMVRLFLYTEWTELDDKLLRHLEKRIEEMRKNGD